MKSLSKMSDAELFSSLERLARDERRNMPRILGRLAEIDKRKAAAENGSSLFGYCRTALRWSEGETARRIQVARAADRFRAIYSHLWNGGLNLTTAAILSPHLTEENHRGLIAAALRQSQRHVESLVASIAPEPEQRERIRILGPRPLERGSRPDATLFEPRCGTPAPQDAPPTRRTAAPEHAQERAPAPPRPSRVELSFAVDEPLARELEDARALLRNKYPFCRVEDVFREALRALLERLDPERRPEPAARPRARKPCTRRIPPAVRAYVWKRDKGRCAYVGPKGERCGSRAFLEFDHIRPFAMGGPSDEPANVRLLCRTHNIHMSRRVFGFI